VTALGLPNQIYLSNRCGKLAQAQQLGFGPVDQVSPGGSPAFVLPADAQSALLVARLFPASRVTHNALVGGAGSVGRLWHALFARHVFRPDLADFRDRFLPRPPNSKRARLDTLNVARHSTLPTYA